MRAAMSKNKEVAKTNMIKTLRITSIVAVLLGVVIFVIPAVSGFRSDEKIEQLLNSPGVIEKAEQAKGGRAERSESQISPLVKQAEAFALYLNPPPPKRRRAPVPKLPSLSKPRPPRVSAKFKLIGTSYYAQRPEQSLALIDEPGKGRRWVRQSSSVGHLVIEQVKDGLVVIRDNQRTFELPVVARPKRRSLVAGGSASGQSRAPSKTVRRPGGADAVVRKPPEIDPEEQAAERRMLIDELKGMQTDLISDKADSEGGDDESAALQEFILELEAMRVSEEEAKQLDRLGKELNGLDLQLDPNLRARYEGRRGRFERRPGRQGVDIPETKIPEANIPETNSPDKE